MPSARESQRRRSRFVLFFCRYRTHAAYEKLAGMSDFERQRNRVVRFIHYSAMTQPVEAYIGCWNPVGIISDDVRFRAPPGCRTCPTVFIDATPGDLRRGDVSVQYDSFGAGRLAAAEFMREGLTNFAFIGSFGPRYWSDERQAGFAEAVAESGGCVDVYGGERTLDDVLAIQSGIAEWIRALPKPCGVFAANDQVGEYVLGTCRYLGVKVPDEIAVIGVDNDETICENTFESLTSIEPDFREAGRLAAKTLESRLRSGRAESAVFGSTRVVRRQSSHMMRRPDYSVRQVLETIRREACLGMKARDALALMNCSRRAAEMRFRAATGMSPLEAIDKVRLDRAVELLAVRDMSLSAVAEKTAFASETMFRRFFKRRTGLSPQDWRQENCR